MKFATNVIPSVVRPAQSLLAEPHCYHATGLHGLAVVGWLGGSQTDWSCWLAQGPL